MIYESHDDRNPLIVVSRERVLQWLREIADNAGFADRGINAVQINTEHAFAPGVVFHQECPTLTIMVSNIPGTRPSPVESEAFRTSGKESEHDDHERNQMSDVRR